MITLFTGKPGNGKTALVVSLLMETSGRPLFVMGIPELKLEHNPVPPVSEWTELRPDPDDPSVLLPYFTFPQGSLIVIDEAQRVYRPRATAAKVPDIVAAFETHRHTGVDFWLITQDVGLLDSNIRRLVTQHFHIRTTAFGRYKYEWPELGEPDNKTSREIARKTRYKPPSKAFSMYKSADSHTVVKIGLPWYFYVFLLSVLATIGGSYYAYRRVTSMTDKPADIQTKVYTSDTAQNAAPVQNVAHLSKQEYGELLMPRFPNLMHTAPIYDKVTEAVAVPEPVGCFASGSVCRCYTQQATRYETSEETCRAWLSGDRYFKPWKAAAGKPVDLSERLKQ